MERVWAAIHYFSHHPFIGLAAAAGLLVIHHLLNQKSQLSREAEERLRQLRKERGEIYRAMRPLR